MLQYFVFVESSYLVRHGIVVVVVVVLVFTSHQQLRSYGDGTLV